MLSCHLMSKCKFCVPKWNHWYSFRFCQIITSLISLQVNSIRVASNNFLSDLSLKPGSRPGNVTPKSFQPGISEWATFDPVMECLRGGGGQTPTSSLHCRAVSLGLEFIGAAVGGLSNNISHSDWQVYALWERFVGMRSQTWPTFIELSSPGHDRCKAELSQNHWPLWPL